MRSVERRPAVAEALATADVNGGEEPDVLVRARAAIDHEVMRQLGSNMRRKRPPSPAEVSSDVDIFGDGRLEGEIVLRGVQWSVRILRERLTMKKVGMAPPLPEATDTPPDPLYVWPAAPWLFPVTRRNWLAAVLGAVESVSKQTGGEITIGRFVTEPRPHVAIAIAANIGLSVSLWESGKHLWPQDSTQRDRPCIHVEDEVTAIYLDVSDNVYHSLGQLQRSVARAIRLLAARAGGPVGCAQDPDSKA